MSFDDAVTSAMVSDALDAVGIRDRAMDPAVMRLSGPTRIIGTAATIQFAPAGDVDPADPYGDMIDAIDGIAPGQVVVVATGGSEASAYWGELFSAAATGRRAAGVVTDGYLRDLDRIRALDFPAFAAGTRPVDFRGRMRVVERAGRIEVGGVVLDAGDTIVADSDGVVAVPARAMAEVARIANDRALRESTVLAELLSGAGLREVWERHGIL